MMSIYRIFVVLLAGIITTAAQSNPFFQRFAWQVSPSPEVVTYHLYHTTNSVALATNNAVIGWNRIVLTNWTAISGVVTNPFLKTNFVAGVTNWVCLTAADASGIESEPSNIIPYVPAKPATMLRLLLQVSPSIDGPWETLTNHPPIELPLSQPALFSRIFHEVR